MERIAISDTNIFIDLIEIELLDEFFGLPWEIHTTDMIVHELKNAKQHEKIAAYCGKSLHVKSFEVEEMIRLIDFHATQHERTNVTLQDCSVWFYAMESSCTLLTGDAKLRNAARKSGVDVHGVIYVIDKLVEENILSCRDAIDKLKQLKMLNQRLPLPEIEKRIKLWTE